ncbi:MAG: PqqD family protein, partial [Frisingicoccus sp.]|nr:PqqD family protein [Frisingicoccus sp.]
SGMITTNEVGAFLWEQLQDEISKDELLKRLLDEFETEPDVVSNDVEEFLEQMRKLDLLEEFSE